MIAYKEGDRMRLQKSSGIDSFCMQRDLQIFFDVQYIYAVRCC